jgi:hypothetical protein
VADWVTISALATAGGTLVLAAATFSSVKSANRAARVAERSMLASQRPLLMHSKVGDETQKVGFADGTWLTVPGGTGEVQLTDTGIYFAMSLRNVGTGMAVLHGWVLPTEQQVADNDHTGTEQFHRLTRDLYVAGADIGFWQGVIREHESDEYRATREAVQSSRRIVVDVLYGDHEGGQRVISRFGLTPREDGQWIAAAARHWNLDRPDPR